MTKKKQSDQTNSDAQEPEQSPAPPPNSAAPSSSPDMASPLMAVAEAGPSDPKPGLQKPTPGSPPRKPPVPRTQRRKTAPEATQLIGVTDDQLKAAFATLLMDQRNAYTGQLTHGEGLVAHLGEHQWLDQEHVDGIIRYLVSQRESMRTTVGVYPVFNEPFLFERAQNLIYDQLIARQDKRPANTPLPSLEGLVGEILIETRNANRKEESRRAQQEAALRDEATAILDRNGFSQRNMFPYYLDCVLLNNQLLGNIAKTEMPHKECDQYIIPLLLGGHYSVLVVDCYIRTSTNARCANIKYYDSKGQDLSGRLREQVSTFFREKGWSQVEYENRSAKDQPDTTDCGLWTAFKAIDLVSINLTPDNPELILNGDPQQMGQLRQVSRIWLREIGFNVTDIAAPQPSALDRTASWQQAETELLAWISRFVTELKAQNPDLTIRDPKALWRLCDTYAKEVEARLKTLLALNEKTVEDTASIKALQKLLAAYAPFAKDLKKIALEYRDIHKPTTHLWDPILQIVREFPWRRAAIITSLLCLTAYFGGPYLLEGAVAAGTFLPVNPVMTIFAAALVFVTSFQLVTWVSNFVGASATDEPVVPPSITPPTRLNSVDFSPDQVPAPVPEPLIDPLLPKPPAILTQANRASSSSAPPPPSQSQVETTEVIELQDEDDGAGVDMDRGRRSSVIEIS